MTSETVKLSALFHQQHFYTVLRYAIKFVNQLIYDIIYYLLYSFKIKKLNSIVLILL